jgi:hypothetical protein
MDRKWITENCNFYDYIKHMTTLSTGALVVLITFADKFSTASSDKTFFIWGIILLLTTIFSALVSMVITLSIQRYNDTSSVPKKERDRLALSLLGMWGSFFCSLISISIFTVVNL